MRILQGLGGGPIIPIAQAVLWEIFPPHQRGMAMAVWGLGIVLAPTFGPTVGGWIADNWSWRWIFYINLPIGVLGFFMASALLFDSAHAKPPGRVDVSGLLLMVLGFGCLQLVLDRGEREDWFDSTAVTAMAVVAVVALAAFVIRELTAVEPLVDLAVFADRNFTLGSVVMALAGFGFYASMLLLALFTQKLMSYDAWTSGLVLAPSGIGQAIMLVIVGRLVSRVDQRWLLCFGVLMNGLATLLMSNASLGSDFWALAWPRLVQGIGMGCIFVPLQMLALASVPIGQLPERDGAVQRGQERRGERGGGHRDHAPQPARPDAPVRAGRARQRVGSRDRRAPAPVDRPFPDARGGHRHGRAPGDGDALSRDPGPGPGPRLHGRLPRPRRDVRGPRRSGRPDAPRPPRPRRHDVAREPLAAPAE